MRTFVATEISKAIRENLANMQQREWINVEGIRWVKPERMHLTLKFLGEIEPTALPGVTQAIQNASEAIKPFDLEVRGLGFFPNPKRPRIFWAGIEEVSGALEALYLRLQESLAALGFEKEFRGFRPHLTLARFKGKVEVATNPDGWDNAVFGAQTVREIILFKSELKPQGPIYTPLSIVTLKE